jgi:hypothetical protein
MVNSLDEKEPSGGRGDETDAGPAGMDGGGSEPGGGQQTSNRRRGPPPSPVADHGHLQIAHATLPGPRM